MKRIIATLAIAAACITGIGAAHPTTAHAATCTVVCVGDWSVILHGGIPILVVDPDGVVHTVTDWT